ncbi:hypothetical protein P152DRAFT_455422 [Eremomyces bilateralis CBS 781.70]|uniref:Uncharacterized protein n=1 Tax=Eremomyces bilateralis CBS 781.70 TaxID=1392243 RepID=A0A6G1GC89_9PEZI|nr:uncharacterized protein P152DRAFT_455422 [Eremomyces bilateralis CBS 781.70]KAF1815707.1 hypothetical protein P152DRAFT_455422 [Eremomyces bilateralis CBS 781.70]
MTDTEFETSPMVASFLEQVAVDIPCLTSCISALIDCTESALPLVTELQDRASPSAASTLEQQCRQLSKLSTELKTILGSYSLQVESSGYDGSPPPVDPSIGDWVQDTLAAVNELGDQAAQLLEGVMEEKGEEAEGSGHEEGFVEIRSAEQVVKKLVPLSNTLMKRTTFLKEFLPIFKCDLDEYLAKNIAQPNRNGNITTIRSALYDLKDEMRASVPLLEELECEEPMIVETSDSGRASAPPHHRSSISTASTTSRVSDASSTISFTRDSSDPDDFYLVDSAESLAATAKSIRETQMRVFDSLTEILTNHPSDWLNGITTRGKGRSLSWADFQQLDYRKIKVLVKAYRSLNLNLQVITLRCRNEGGNKRKILEKMRKMLQQVCEILKLDADGTIGDDSDLAFL